jgi:hypothetical protein
MDHELQNVEVVRFNSGKKPPPYYKGTTNAFTSLSRMIGASSNEVINVWIPISTGDVIGILGAGGDESQMHNSYDKGPFGSEILGQPVTFRRLGMQYNLANNPARNLWSGDSKIGRVKMFYVATNKAPLPEYRRTYSSASRTRGYWFTAPTSFTIKGLQVPDEMDHGLQNVEVVRFNPGIKPPTYKGNTNAFHSLCRIVGASSGAVINVSLSISAGDVIGILGAAGDETIMHNSYGPGPYTSEVFGYPVTFRRLGMQDNLVRTPAQICGPDLQTLLA